MAAEMPLKTFHHAGLTVSDLKRSTRFYRDGLGFTVEWERSNIAAPYARALVGVEDGVLEIAMLAAPDGALLELVHYATGQGGRLSFAPRNPGCGHLAFDVTDIREVCRRLKELGGSLISDIQQATYGPSRGNLMVYARDPDGAILELVQRRTDV